MLLNGILYNSEVWHSLSEAEVKSLERVDEHLLRALVKAHSKTPAEFLYLESGAVPIRFIIRSRRILYLQVLLQREDNELTKKIYETQKENPSKGDFSELVNSDLKYLSDHLTESYIKSRSSAALNPIQHGVLANLFSTGGVYLPPLGIFNFSGLKIRI